MPGYDDLRAEALELFDLAMSAARRTDAAEALRRLVAARQRLADSLLTVVVCGEFSRGKSTLLNALLGQEQELFPAGVSYTTSLVTTVTYGDPEQITIRLAAADGEPGDLTVSRAGLREYVTQDGNPGNGRRVLSASIELPSEQLASGLALVDTPGIGGMLSEHSVVTSAVLPLADAVVFVADVHQPLTSSEVRFLRRAIDAAQVGDDPDALICVLTKTDQVTGYHDLVDQTRVKIADATGWPRVPVVAVSSRAKIDYLSSGDPDDLADSNFPELEQLLWSTLARRRARAVLAGALADLDGSAAALREPIDSELRALRTAGPDAAAALRTSVDARRRSLAGLGMAAATWRGDLVRDSAEMSREVLRRATGQAERAWQNVPGYLADDHLLGDVSRLLEQVDEDLSMVTSVADRMLYDRAARLQRELAGHLGLALGSAEIRRLPAAPVPTVRDTAPPAGAPGRRRLGDVRASSVVSVSSTVGSALGRLVEMFVAPGAGALAGGALGATAGVLVAATVRLAAWARPGAAAGRRPAEVRRQLQADLDEYYQQALLPYLAEHVAGVTRDWTALITAEIESRIRQEQTSAAQSAQRLSQPAPMDAERAAAREEALLAAAAPLDEVRARAAELARAALDLAAGATS